MRIVTRDGRYHYTKYRTNIVLGYWDETWYVEYLNQEGELESIRIERVVQIEPVESETTVM